MMQSNQATFKFQMHPGFFHVSPLCPVRVVGNASSFWCSFIQNTIKLWLYQ